MLCEVLRNYTDFPTTWGWHNLFLDLVTAMVVSGEAGFKADLSALGCFSLSCAGSFLSFEFVI